MFLSIDPIFCMFVCISTPSSANFWIYFSLIFSFSLQFIINLTQKPALVYFEIFVKVSASECSLALLNFLQILHLRC